MHAGGVCQRFRHGFLADDIETGIEGLQRQRCVKAIGCGDEGRLGLDDGECLVERGKGRSASLLGESRPCRSIGVDPADGSKAATIDGGVPIMTAHATKADAQQTNHVGELLVR